MTAPPISLKWHHCHNRKNCVYLYDDQRVRSIFKHIECSMRVCIEGIVDDGVHGAKRKGLLSSGNRATEEEVHFKEANGAFMKDLQYCIIFKFKR